MCLLSLGLAFIIMWQLARIFGIVKHVKILSLLFAFSLTLVGFAILGGPLLFKLAHSLSFIDGDITDSESISFTLNAILSTALMAVTMAAAYITQENKNKK